MTLDLELLTIVAGLPRHKVRTASRTSKPSIIKRDCTLMHPLQM